jgi:hypothetical protein
MAASASVTGINAVGSHRRCIHNDQATKGGIERPRRTTRRPWTRPPRRTARRSWTRPRRRRSNCRRRQSRPVVSITPLLTFVFHMHMTAEIRLHAVKGAVPEIPGWN